MFVFPLLLTQGSNCLPARGWNVWSESPSQGNRKNILTDNEIKKNLYTIFLYAYQSIDSEWSKAYKQISQMNNFT